jgi:hypothetical protein
MFRPVLPLSTAAAALRFRFTPGIYIWLTRVAGDDAPSGMADATRPPKRDQWARHAQSLSRARI